MPFTKYEDGLFTKNESRKNLLMPVMFSVALSVLAIVTNLCFFPLKTAGGLRVSAVGGLFDGLQFLTLNFILYSFNRVAVRSHIRWWLNGGLIVWIVSAAFDLMDEIISQPAWVGYYVEDVTQLIGMLSVSIGIYHLVCYINNKYADISIDSFRDELTKLPNRRYFTHLLRDLVTKSYYLFFIDIDFFKTINDRYGHDVGDEVLREFGSMMEELMDDGVLVARIGGEEFALIMQTSSRDEAESMADGLLARVQKRVVYENIPLTVSIGVAQKKEDEHLDTLLKRADMALYQAKRLGRNRVEWAG